MLSRKNALGFFIGELKMLSLLLLSFVCIARCTAGNNSIVCIEEPKSPLYITPGETVQLFWRYRLNQPDELHLDKIELGIWNGGVNKALIVTVTRTNSTFMINSNSNSVKWIGSWNSTVAAFNISNVTSSALYYCTLSFNGLRRNLTKVIEIFVRDPPRITRKSSKTTVQKGARLVLLCEVQADPKPLVTWYRNNNVIQNSTFKTNFTIPQVFANTSGMYRCSVVNALGNACYEVKVSVTLDSEHSSEKTIPIEINVPVRRYPQGTHNFLISSLSVGSVFLILLAAYAIFNARTKRTEKIKCKRKFIRDPNDEQAMSLISDWANYEDQGEKL